LWRTKKRFCNDGFGSVAPPSASPLYPSKRTWSIAVQMSANDPKKMCDQRPMRMPIATSVPRIANPIASAVRLSSCKCQKTAEKSSALNQSFPSSILETIHESVRVELANLIRHNEQLAAALLRVHERVKTVQLEINPLRLAALEYSALLGVAPVVDAERHHFDRCQIVVD
jgi:hypothetical protein